MKRLLGCLAVVIVAATSVQAADLRVLKSTPADGSVTDTPPSAFVLEFSDRVKLHDLYLKKDDEKHAKPVHNFTYAEGNAFTIPAPSLTAGGYTLEWTVFTHDSKALTGRVRFTVGGGQSATTLSSAH